MAYWHRSAGGPGAQRAEVSPEQGEGNELRAGEPQAGLRQATNTTCIRTVGSGARAGDDGVGESGCEGG